MTARAGRTCLFIPALLLCSCLDVCAELAGTRLDGLQVSVTAIYRFGDSRDLDCSIGFRFAGEKADRAFGMSPVRIVEAVDDTGKNLVRTNRHSFDGTGSHGKKAVFGFWQAVRGLRAPSPNAKTIRHLEAELDFFGPTTNTPILTNFMSRPGIVQHQPALDEAQIQITYRDPASEAPPGSLVLSASAGKTIELRVDDPNQKIVNLAFQQTGGQILRPARTTTTRFGSRTDYAFGFQEKPPRDLDLVVYIAAPQATDKVRFSLNNVRLPWVDLPDFEASATASQLRTFPRTTPGSCNLYLSFTGGPLTNALGIRRLWVQQAEDDSGLPVKPAFGRGTDGLWDRHFSELPPTPMGNGRNVQKYVPLQFQSRDPKWIRILKGEAELVRSETTNRGTVTIKDFMNRPGEFFDLPLLETNHVKLTFVGQVNYATIRASLSQTNGFVENGGIMPKERPSNVRNALEFLLDDPDNVVISQWGHSQINLLDGHGRDLNATRMLVSGKIRVYRFETLPRPDAQLSLCLAMPESLQRVPFTIKNVPLDSTLPLPQMRAGPTSSGGAGVPAGADAGAPRN